MCAPICRVSYVPGRRPTWTLLIPLKNFTKVCSRKRQNWYVSFNVSWTWIFIVGRLNVSRHITNKILSAFYYALQIMSASAIWQSIYWVLYIWLCPNDLIFTTCLLTLNSQSRKISFVLKAFLPHHCCNEIANVENFIRSRGRVCDRLLNGTWPSLQCEMKKDVTLPGIIR